MSPPFTHLPRSRVSGRHRCPEAQSGAYFCRRHSAPQWQKLELPGPAAAPSESAAGCRMIAGSNTQTYCRWDWMRFLISHFISFTVSVEELLIGQKRSSCLRHIFTSMDSPWTWEHRAGKYQYSWSRCKRGRQRRKRAGGMSHCWWQSAPPPEGYRKEKKAN